MSFLDHFRRRPNPTPERDPRPSPEPAAVPPPAIRQVAAAEVYAAMQAGEPLQFLDVRMPWDFAAQHPAGATSLPLNELAERVGELDRTQRIVLSCYHGYSSQDGVAFLLAEGFERVENLQGGFSGWAQAALPIERP